MPNPEPGHCTALPLGGWVKECVGRSKVFFSDLGEHGIPHLRMSFEGAGLVGAWGGGPLNWCMSCIGRGSRPCNRFEKMPSNDLKQHIRRTVVSDQLSGGCSAAILTNLDFEPGAFHALSSTNQGGHGGCRAAIAGAGPRGKRPMRPGFSASRCFPPALKNTITAQPPLRTDQASTHHANHCMMFHQRMTTQSSFVCWHLQIKTHFAAGTDKTARSIVSYGSCGFLWVCKPTHQPELKLRRAFGTNLTSALLQQLWFTLPT